jgi:hypothetical protein
MKCSEAKELALTQGLSTEQLEALRAHARDCATCRFELESAFLALVLRETPPESPPPTFADAVMARIETVRVQRRFSGEQILAAVFFLVAVCTLSFVLHRTQMGIFRESLNGIILNLPIGAIKETIIATVHVLSTVLAVLVEISKEARRQSAVNFLTAIVVACALIMVLVAGRSTRYRVEPQSERY